MTQKFHNRAFISYSQKDRRQALQVQRWFEKAKTVGEEGEVRSAKKFGRVFLDQTDLTTASDLGDEIKKELRASEFLIVICSPNSASSDWVENEVSYFRSIGRGDNVFALILSGIPNSGDPTTECFPPSFRKNGAESKTFGGEPMAADVSVDGVHRAYTRLLAGMEGRRFDDLWRREVKRQRNRTIVASAFSFVGVLLTFCAAFAGWVALTGIAENARNASRLTTLSSQQFSEESDHVSAMLAALYADPAASDTMVTRLFDGEEGYQWARNQLVRSMNDNRLVSINRIPDETVIAFDYSDDGNELMIVTREGTASFWSSAVNKHSRTVELGRGVGDAELVLNDSRIATLDDGGVVSLFDSSTGQRLKFFETGTPTAQLMFFNGDASFLVGARDFGVTLYRGFSLESGEKIESLGASFRAFAQSKDGEKLAVGIADGIVHVLNSQTLEILRTIEIQTRDISALALSPDGGYLAVNTRNNQIGIWNVETGVYERALPGHQVPIQSLEFSPEASVLFSGSEDGDIRIWSLSTGAHLETLGGHKTWVEKLSLHASGTKLASYAVGDNIRIWDVKSFSKSDLPSGALSGLTALGLSNDQRLLAAGYSDGAVALWDVESQTLLKNVGSHEAIVSSLEFSPYDNQLLSSSFDGKIAVWELSDEGTPVTTVKLEDWATGAVYAPDGTSFFASSKDGSITEWSTETGELKRLLRGGSGNDWVSSIDLTPDGLHLLVSVLTGSVYEIDLSSLEVQRSVTDDFLFVQSASYSASGRYVQASSFDGKTRIWRKDEWGNFSPKVTMVGHKNWIFAAEFSRDERWLASGSSDGTARLWDIESGVNLATLYPDSGTISTIVFGPDAQTLIVGTDKFVPFYWKLPDTLFKSPEVLIEDACDQLREIDAPLQFNLTEMREAGASNPLASILLTRLRFSPCEH